MIATPTPAPEVPTRPGPRRTTRPPLALRPGEMVEVLSAAEIRATLDDDGMLDALPFMPEMLQHCGKRFRVYRRADKTCDTIGTSPTHARRMRDAVHLEGLRCDGAAHGGCQAQCLLFWKEAWLRRASEARDRQAALPVPQRDGDAAAADREEPLVRLSLRTRRDAPADAAKPPVYMCQATELVRATTPLPWWEPRQYARDLLGGNVGLATFAKTLGRAAFNALQRARGGRQFPAVEATCTGETPTGTLDLQPGERVRIRSKEEIFATLNQQGRNRGLYFDVEMLPFCGRTAVVRQRVEQIISEQTGEMLHFSNPCIILEDVACSGCLSRERLFCPRAIYSYWREIWLERVPVAAPAVEHPASHRVLQPAGPPRGDAAVRT